MKTKFNEFLLEYIKNEKLANYVLNNIMNKLKKYYSNYKFIEIDDNIKFMFDFKKILITENSDIAYNISYSVYKDVINNEIKLISKDESYDSILNLDKGNIKKYLQNLKFKYLEQGYIISYYQDIHYKLTIHIKDVYIKREKPPRYVYHTTTEKNLKNILDNGLELRNSDQSEFNLTNKTYPDAIFVSDYENLFTYKSVILEIDTTMCNNKWFSDINSEEGRYMTFEPINKNAIKKINSDELYKKYNIDNDEN
jgi:hypothetical protein